MRENRSTSTPSTYLPEHLVISIFEYLPVKSLLRFRAVSKSFCFLIHKSSFVAAHLKHSNNIYDPNKHPNVLYNFDITPNSCRLTLYNETTESPCGVYNFPTPSNKKMPGDVIGYCNGVVCLMGSDFKSFYFWNPLLNKSVKHRLQPSYRSTLLLGLGFGYDSRNNHFKLVCLLDDYTTGQVSAKLHTVNGIGNTNTWRISSIPAPQIYGVIFDHKPSAVYVNDALNWLVEARPDGDRFPLSILSLHMENEVFQELALPCPSDQLYSSDSHAYFKISEFNGMLCVFPFWLDLEKPFTVWVMKEYGKAESWVPLLNMRLTIGKSLKVEYKFYDREVVVGWKNNGEEVLVFRNSGSQLCGFNQKTLKLRELKRIPTSNRLFCGTYMESLALMDIYGKRKMSFYFNKLGHC